VVAASNTYTVTGIALAWTFGGAASFASVIGEQAVANIIGVSTQSTPVGAQITTQSTGS
jgi:hypothetical protein